MCVKSPQNFNNRKIINFDVLAQTKIINIYPNSMLYCRIDIITYNLHLRQKWFVNNYILKSSNPGQNVGISAQMKIRLLSENTLTKSFMNSCQNTEVLVSLLTITKIL